MNLETERSIRASMRHLMSAVAPADMANHAIASPSAPGKGLALLASSNNRPDRRPCVATDRMDLPPLVHEPHVSVAAQAVFPDIRSPGRYETAVLLYSAWYTRWFTRGSPDPSC